MIIVMIGVSGLCLCCPWTDFKITRQKITIIRQCVVQKKLGHRLKVRVTFTGLNVLTYSFDGPKMTYISAILRSLVWHSNSSSNNRDIVYSWWRISGNYTMQLSFKWHLNVSLSCYTVLHTKPNIQLLLNQMVMWLSTVLLLDNHFGLYNLLCYIC